jgi:cytochrome c-type biogenesis protein CcmH/NrfF
VRRCRSEKEVEDALVAQFGPEVLALPPDHGVGATAYLVPAVGAALALAGLAWLFAAWRRRGRRSVAEAQPAPSRLSRADERRLEAELDRLR